MPELRSRPVIKASMADYRPVTAGSGDDPAAHHNGDGQQSRGPVLRSRRNGLPETPLYRYRQSSYDWAIRNLRAAEAEHGLPPATRGPRPRRAQKPGGQS